MSCRTNALAVVLLIAATAAVAQPRDRRPGASFTAQGEVGLGLHDEGSSRRVLLLDPLIQKELKLSDAQKGRLKAVEAGRSKEMARFAEEFRARTREALGDRPDPRAVAALEEGVRPAAEGINREHESACVKVLDRGQRARLGQIQLQAEGPFAFTRPEVHRRLNLAPAQIQAIMALVAEGDDEMSRAAALSEDDSPDPQGQDDDRPKAEPDERDAPAPKARAAMANIRGSTMRAIAKILTKGQREKYRKMVGEPFDFKKSRGAAEPSKPGNKSEDRPPQ